jgi:hypothetical protein
MPRPGFLSGISGLLGDMGANYMAEYYVPNIRVE